MWPFRIEQIPDKPNACKNCNKLPASLLCYALYSRVTATSPQAEYIQGYQNSRPTLVQALPLTNRSVFFLWKFNFFLWDERLLNKRVLVYFVNILQRNQLYKYFSGTSRVLCQMERMESKVSDNKYILVNLSRKCLLGQIII